MVKKLKVTFVRLAYLVLAVFLVLIAPAPAQAVQCTDSGYNLILDNATEYTEALDDIWKDVTYSTSITEKTRITENVNTCFLVPVSYIQTPYTQFIVRSRDLYILGFRTGNRIYTFNDQDPNIIPEVPGTVNVNLGYGGNYNSIYPDAVRNQEFGSTDIIGQLAVLQNATPQGDLGRFKTGLAYGAFFISESLRFHAVNATFTEVFENPNMTITFNQKLDPYVFEWGDCSQAYLFGNQQQQENAGRVLKTANGNMNNPGVIPNCN